MLTPTTIRLATRTDIPALRALIRASAHELSDGFYTPVQRDAAMEYVFGVDTTLIDDGTYFVVGAGSGADGVTMAGCGGWSKRRTLFGGDQHKTMDDPLLDPRTDAARIRAFFVHPQHARRGIGGLLLQACASAAFDAGYRALELMATLPGVPLYASYGFMAQEDVLERTPGGVTVPFVRMHRPLTSPALSRSARP